MPKKTTDLNKKAVSKNVSSKSKTTKKTNSKKITITVDKEFWEEIEKYLNEYNKDKDTFIKQAIKEKISKDRISDMISYYTK